MEQSSLECKQQIDHKLESLLNNFVAEINLTKEKLYEEIEKQVRKREDEIEKVRKRNKDMEKNYDKFRHYHSKLNEAERTRFDRIFC